MQILYSELAAQAMAKLVPDISRRKTCEVHLKFYLLSNPLEHSVRCSAFDDIDIFIYRFGPYRVIFHFGVTIVTVWSFTVVTSSAL